VVLRADRLNSLAIEEAVKRLLFSPEFSFNARAVAAKIKKHNTFNRLDTVLDGLIG
jgi:hypothetical protein